MQPRRAIKPCIHPNLGSGLPMALLIGARSLRRTGQAKRIHVFS